MEAMHRAARGCHHGAVRERWRCVDTVEIVRVVATGQSSTGLPTVPRAVPASAAPRTHALTMSFPPCFSLEPPRLTPRNM